MRKTVLFGFLGALIFSGCATRAPVTYPAYKTAPTVAVSATTLSTATETPAGDYLVDNSQVFVRGSNYSEGGAAMLGLIGAIAGIAADRANNASAVAEVKSQLSIKFVKDLNEALSRTTSLAPFKGQLQLLAPDTAADLLLLPYAVLETEREKRARLTFQITSRFTSAENVRQKKTYAYASPGVDTPVSWTANDNAQIRQFSDVAFDRLTATFVNDLAGKYRERVGVENRLFTTWQINPDGPVLKGFLLEDAAGYQVVVPLFQEQPVSGFILLVDRLFVKGGERQTALSR